MGAMKKWLLRANIDAERQRLAKRMQERTADGDYSCPICGDFRCDFRSAVMERQLKSYETALAFLDDEKVARTDLVQAYYELRKRREAINKTCEKLSQERGTKYEEPIRSKAFKQVENKIARYLDKEDA